MKLILAGLLVVGLVLAPGYFLYCTVFSGKAVGSYPVFTQDVNRTGVGVVSVTSVSNAKWESPVTLPLTTDMNPITVDAKFKYIKPKSIFHRVETGFRSVLRNGEDEIWQQDIRLSLDDDKEDDSSNSLISSHPKTTISVKTFSIEEDGDYQLDVRQEGENEITVASLEMAVRRNVIIPNSKIVLGGVASLLISIVGLIFAFRKSA